MKRKIKPTGDVFISDVFVNSLKVSKKVILGIDPGLNFLGFSMASFSLDKAVEVKTYKLGYKKRFFPDISLLMDEVVSYSLGFFKMRANRGIEEKLAFILDNLVEVLERFSPDLVVVEDAFVGLNKSSALKLGIVRGAILSAIGKYGKTKLEVISPRQVKMEICGNGSAEKEELLQVFEGKLKNWPDSIQIDASDAFAVALCGAKLLF